MAFEFFIPSPDGQTTINIETGSSVVFVGANGSGKTRLAVQIEGVENLSTHRISAHRALSINTTVPKISERSALLGLRIGSSNEHASVQHRSGSRWNGKMATSLLNDFDFLVQALFADQTNKSLKTHQMIRSGDYHLAEPTKFERLIEIWDHLLPHRKLHISGDDIQVSIPGVETTYNASEMSDGERAIFYTIGQTLAAAENSLLIFDEPELHIHRSIMSKLWDELEAARQDCAFVFITHDLGFAASRDAQKFSIKNYEPIPCWAIETVPENTGFDEELTTLILGSRSPVLFVEGAQNSLDLAIYRCCYPDFTVIPMGSCKEVIYSVTTMRRNREFTRITCSGIVDSDSHELEDITYLGNLGIMVLSVSEIENIILLPEVSTAIAESEGYKDAELESKLNKLKIAIFATINSDAMINDVIKRYCLRRIDQHLKNVDLSATKNLADLQENYDCKTKELNIADIAQKSKERIQLAIQQNDLPMLLANYDNKGLLGLAAQHLKASKLSSFKSWLTRALKNGNAPEVIKAISNNLPKISPM